MNKIYQLAIITLFISCKVIEKTPISTASSYPLSSISNLNDSTYTSKIEKFYTTAKEGFFEGKANKSIHYRVYEQPTIDKAILISSGRTEAAIKYKELIYDLYQNGYSVYIHDHRGQGLSDRMTTHADMGYIDEFQYYIDDMKQFYTNMIAPKKYPAIFLLAHSMGGAIGMTYIQQHTQDFNAASFSSPMLGLKPPICWLAQKLDNGEPKFAVGESEYNDSKVSFKENKLTGSEIRFNRMATAFAVEPKAKLGGVSYTWLNKSCQQFDYMNNHIEKIQIPFILFSAENEQIVSTKAHKKFIATAKQLGKNCELYFVANAQHELLIEKDPQRQHTLQTTLEFYERIIKNSKR